MALVSLLATGCDAPIDSFNANRQYAKRLELTESINLAEPQDDAIQLLEELFGTPDAPKWPSFLESDGQDSIVSIDGVQRAAGAVGSDQSGAHRGLYREHCITCHGVSGDGAGPSAALLNPYPRDFRLGKFKFKSTPTGKKATRDDLRRILTNGIAGTSMPSFGLLPPNEVNDLVDYVIYLSVRGELERQLLTEAALELDLEGGERLYDPDLREADPDEFTDQWQAVQDRAIAIVDQWRQAKESSLVVDGPPPGFPLVGMENANQDQLLASIANGEKLFLSKVASCAFCHGTTAEGDGQQNNYDDWTRDWTVLAGIDPKNEQELAPMLELGALKPRNILPRNMHRSVFRGGASPEELYTRIVHGIEGTPMPALPRKPGNPQGLTEEEVWDLVNYLLSLPASRVGTKPIEGKGATNG